MAKWYKFGRYYLLRHIATGGMAEIFLSKQIGLEGFEKLLVVKKILNQYLENEEFITMFLDEARLAAKLDHPNIVRIYDLGKQEKNYYIAMEYIPGEDLRTILRKVSKQSKLVPQQHSLHIVSSVCEALDYAHKKKNSAGEPLGVIHRDISPQNVMVSYEGNVKLLDFGIAKASTQSNETEAGVLKGKYAYMSPEQAKGQKLDNRSDIFSVGILLFELLTNHRLFKAASQLDTLKKLVYEEIPSPKEFNEDITDELEKIVMKALSKDLDKRYTTAREFQKDIEDYLASNRIVASTTRVSEFMHETFKEEIVNLQSLEQKIDEEQKELSIDDIADISKDDALSQLDNDGLSSFNVRRGGNTSLSSWSKIGTSATNGSYGSQSGVFSAQTPITNVGPAGATRYMIFLTVIAILGIGGFLGYKYIEGNKNRNKKVVEVKKETGSVYIKSEPSNATILVNGEKYKGSTPTIVKDIPLNELVIIKIKKNGFTDIVKELTLKSKKTQDIEVKLLKSEENVGIIKIFSEPKGALIYLDSKKLEEVTPATIEGVSVGKHSIVLDLKGYDPYSFDFNIEKNKFKELSKKLYKVGTVKNAFISLLVEPSDAKVTINGKVVELPINDYEIPYDKDVNIIVRKSGYKPFKVTKKLKRGERESLEVKLIKLKSKRTTNKVKASGKPGKLNIMTLKDLSIYIDGKKEGEGSISIFLAAGTHKVKLVSNSRMINYKTVIKVESNKEVTKTIMLKKGKLSVSIKPWADVYINGNRIGQTPFPSKKLYEGTYTVTFKNPKYSSYSKTIKIRPGKTTLIMKDLQK